MLSSFYCRLCTNICDDTLNLFDKNGQSTEVYVLVVKYFTPTVMNRIWGQHLKNICMECWNRLYEFHAYQQTVMVAQRKLALSCKPPPLYNPRLTENGNNFAVMSNQGREHSTNANVTPINVNPRSNMQELQSETSLMNEEDIPRIQSRTIMTDARPQTNSQDLRILSVKNLSILSQSLNSEHLKNRNTPFFYGNHGHELPGPIVSESIRNAIEENPFRGQQLNAISSGTDETNAEAQTNSSNIIISKSFQSPTPELLANSHTSIFHGNQGIERCGSVTSERLQKNALTATYLQSQNNVANILDRQYESVLRKELEANPPKASQTATPVHGDLTNNSSMAISHGFIKSEESENSAEELDEYDEPVGIFAGGEFGNHSYENMDVETRFLCGSDLSAGNLSSDYGDMATLLADGNCYEPQKKRKQAGYEINFSEEEASSDEITSDDETPLVVCATTSKQMDNETTKHSDGNFTMDIDDLSDASMSSETAGNPRKQIKPPYLKNVKRPKTAQEFDDFIANWRPSLECVICQESLSSFSLLLQHFSEKHPTEQCYISCCQHKFYHRYEIEKHIHYHNESKAYKCEVCFKLYTTNNALQRHLLNGHSGTAKESFKCPTCTGSFSHKSTLRQHIKYHCVKKSTKEINRLHSCPECNRSFKSVKILRGHYKRRHLGNLHSMKCTICDREFERKPDLRDHMEKHTGDRSHVCQFCPVTYVHRRNLSQHLLVAHPKEYDALKRKKAEHSKLKKIFKCSTCDKVYQTLLALEEHQATHQGKALYQCNHCPKEYKYSSNLAVHRKRAHPSEHLKNVEKNKRKDDLEDLL